MALAIVAMVALPTSGCELVLGMTGHSATEAPADAGGDGASDGASDVGADTGPKLCTLPATGDAAARVTNVLPSTNRYDFCLKPDTAGAPTIGPVFSVAVGCAGGLAYKDSSASFPVPSGSYEVDVIAAGPKAKCTDAPVTTISHVAFDPGTTTNAILMGDGGSDHVIKALRETVPSNIESRFRFVHAIDGSPAQDFGLALKASLPAQLSQVYLRNIAFGTTSPAGTSPGGSIDANGYAGFSGSGAVLDFGRANTGTPDVLDLLAVKLVAHVGYSIYAVGKTDATGKPNDINFPTELLLCNEHDVDRGVYARCANAVPIDLTLDIVNTQLNGPYSPNEAVRRQPLQQAIAKLNGDVACITEVWSEADKDAIVAAAHSTYTYSARKAMDLTTPIDDATDQNGNTPPTPTTPPCGDAQSKADLEAYLGCVQHNCAVKADDPTSHVEDQAASCIASNCPVEAITLESDSPRGWDCGLVNFFGRASFADTQTACESNPLARYAFSGTNGILLLSRYPIDGTPDFISLGATDFRVTLMRAPVAIDVNTKVDAYCIVTTTPAPASLTRPYVGDYGGYGGPGRTCASDSDCLTKYGETCDLAGTKTCQIASDQEWRNELLLQVGKVANHVAQLSGATKRRAIVLGDWYTGPQLGTLTALNVESYNALTALLPLAVSQGYNPLCTYCADNANTTPPGTQPTAASSWSTYGLLTNIPITDVESNAITLQDATVPVTDPTVDGGTYKVPVSPYYGFRTVVRIRP